MSEAQLHRARVLHQTGDLAGATRLYQDMLAANPRSSDAAYGLGLLHFQSGRHESAEHFLGLAAVLNPHAPRALFLHGCALLSLARHEAALRRFDAALALAPSLAESWINRGNALSALGRHAEAVPSYERALTLRPNAAIAAINMGTALIELGRTEDALASYRRARVLQPSAEALSGEANALFQLKRYGEAADAYEATLRAAPDCRYAIGNLLYCRLHNCDWQHYATLNTTIGAGLAAGDLAITPAQNVARCADPAEQLQLTQRWVDATCPPQPPLWRGERYAHEKIRIAYLSADLHAHAVTTLSVGLFESHDRSRFETYALSLGPDDGSAMRARLKGAFDHFLDMRGRSDADIAGAIHAAKIDVLVDMMGYSGECRPRVLAQRPAPVQVSFLGYAATTGAPFIDYFIADAITLPPGSEQDFSEQIIRLPFSFMPGDDTRAVGPTPSSADAGLPETGFVFCCFNNPYKFTPALFDIWMRLLATMPHSLLWLSDASVVVRDHLAAEARQRGVDPGRLVFAPFALSSTEHLGRLARADLFLDTLPYNAHSTAHDALWVGVPVLTCVGKTFAGRVAASLLTAAGLPDMITHSLEDYEARARALAAAPAELGAVRERLARNRTASPLFDTTRFTRHLESAYQRMVLQSRDGKPPTGFDVGP